MDTFLKIADQINKEISEILQAVLSGGKYRTEDGFCQWGLVEAEIHKRVELNLTYDEVPVAEDERGWTGVDLDGTLAHYDGWKGPDHIGEPIPAMLERVKMWLQMGQRVKIFTARCYDPAQIPPVKAWLEKHGLGGLEVTNVKDFKMLSLWDDRCIQVIPNTGEAVGGEPDV